MPKRFPLRPAPPPRRCRVRACFIDGLKTEVTLSEYLAIMDKQTMHEDPRSVLDSAFTIFDAEGKGTVDTTELRSVIGNLGEGFSSEEIGQMMLMADIDSDGKMQIEGAAWFGVPAARAARHPPNAYACAHPLLLGAVPRTVHSLLLAWLARPASGSLPVRRVLAKRLRFCASARHPDLIKFCVDYK